MGWGGVVVGEGADADLASDEAGSVESEAGDFFDDGMGSPGSGAGGHGDFRLVGRFEVVFSEGFLGTFLGGERS